LKRPGWTVPFEMFADIILTRDIPELGLRVGDVGTIVERHLVPDGREEGYSVEFFNMTGNTVAVVTVLRSAFPRQPIDRPYEPSTPERPDGTCYLPQGIDREQPKRPCGSKSRGLAPPCRRRRLMMLGSGC
jgi:hypothetical protein